MEKDDRLLAAVARICDRFGASVELVDYWDADLLALGISRRDEPKRLVYVSMLPDQDGRFDVSLELPPRAGSERPYEDAGWHYDLTLGEVFELVASHLGLS